VGNDKDGKSLFVRFPQRFPAYARAQLRVASSLIVPLVNCNVLFDRAILQRALSPEHTYGQRKEALAKWIGGAPTLIDRSSGQALATTRRRSPRETSRPWSIGNENEKL